MASKPQGGGGSGRGGGGRGGGDDRGRRTYEMKVATDLDYATQRLNMLKERYNKRQEVLGQVQQQEVAHAQQAAQRVAAALGKDAAPRQQQGEGQQQQQQLAAGPS